MMNSFKQSVLKVITGALKAFEVFPAANASAFGFAIVTIVRIQLDWPQQEPYNFLFNCLHWSFALAAIYSLAAITAAESQYGTRKAFVMANLSGAAVAVVVFLVLYLFGKADPGIVTLRYDRLSALAQARIGMLMLVSLLTFLVFARKSNEEHEFSNSFFMTHKAFFIALIYGAVIMGGTSGVVGAFQALVYKGMSEKVYMYIGTIAGFLAFTIFTGYFPSFKAGNVDEHRELAQKQPRFIEVLFGYIVIPLMLAMTAVLFVWAGKTVATGTWPEFHRLTGIANSYALGGLWLHVMVTGTGSRYQAGLAKFYRAVFPITALIILIFEAWALVIRLQDSGLKTEEYFFVLIWIIAAASAVLLLLKKARAHLAIVVVICTLAIVSVLPQVGYQVLPVKAQVSRLENLLSSQGILKDGKLVPAIIEPSQKAREAITDAVSFLAYTEGARLPSWFDKKLSQPEEFKQKLGFAQKWPSFENFTPIEYLSTSLAMPGEPLNISGYAWAVPLQNYKMSGSESGSIVLKGKRGTYRIYWSVGAHGIPELQIKLGEKEILKETLNSYIDRIAKAYPPGKGKANNPTLGDMSLKLEMPEAKILLLFSSVDINVDAQNDSINYWINPAGLYFEEK